MASTAILECGERVGEIDYRNHDEELIDEDFVDETSPGDGEYVLQSETMD